MIAIIDYGMGNLRSVQKGFEKVGSEAVVTADPRVVLEADKIVLPGVGAFRDCMRNLEAAGFVEPILAVINQGRPFLGICVGMQLLFTDSTEFGLYNGLGVIPGPCAPFSRRDAGRERRTKGAPHGVEPALVQAASARLRGIVDNANVYFVHSYYAKPDDAGVIATTTDYGIEFCSAVWRDNIVATQFHPEKSQDVGLTMLKNFAAMKD